MDKLYIQKEADPKLSSIIKCFWQIDSHDDSTIQREKIIPDGYPELIFHYGNVYKTNINGIWQVQAQDLIAGQITNHFFIENTGISKIFAIKLQPWALSELYNISMHEITNKVINIPKDVLDTLNPIKEVATSTISFNDKVLRIENWLISTNQLVNNELSKEKKALDLIIKNRGRDSLKKIQTLTGVSERKLERYFKLNIGLSPKSFSRIIRFSNIFKLIQEDNIDWADIAYLSGFYDQSHFIKNFKEFTGEHPSSYPFFEKNIANFFLKK